MDGPEILFIATGFLFQIVLIVHFAFRKWRFDVAARYGPIVYALSIPACAVSILILLAGKPWWLWLSGFLYLIWGAFGYTVEYVRGIRWRNPPRWPILGPYLTLYLATIMFYGWPLARISRPLWYAYTVLFVISTALNFASHGRPGESG